MAVKYRINIDLERIQANLLTYEGGKLSEQQIRHWLCSVGFTPEAEGGSWLADSDCIDRLHESEIIDLERLENGAELQVAGRGSECV